MTTMTRTQRDAIRAGRPDVWLGAREVGTMGSTMVALQRRGLAEVREHDRRFVYRLTPAGNALRVEWAIDEATKPVAHTPIPVRCTVCGAEAPDGTPGGSCHHCAGEVEAA